MKKSVLLIIMLSAIYAPAQNSNMLKNHFEAYYQQMKVQGDVQGVIDAMTHLNLLDPNTARRDTLAYVYAAEGRYVEALNTIGIESNTDDSDMNIEVKAIALKSLNQPKRALAQYERLFQRAPTAYLAYEMADLKTQTQDFAGARTDIEYGMNNLEENMKWVFYESQKPYQVPLKAAFLYLDALVTFNEDKVNNVDKAIALLDQALAIEPQFNMAKLSKDALVAKKAEEKK